MNAEIVQQPQLSGVWRRTACGGTFTALVNAHAFDILRHGYVILLASPSHESGASARTVAARTQFLGAGHFTPLPDAIADIAMHLNLAGLSGVTVPRSSSRR